jgi:hypothetical protein
VVDEGDNSTGDRSADQVRRSAGGLAEAAAECLHKLALGSAAFRQADQRHDLPVQRHWNQWEPFADWSDNSSRPGPGTGPRSRAPRRSRATSGARPSPGPSPAERRGRRSADTERRVAPAPPPASARSGRRQPPAPVHRIAHLRHPRRPLRIIAIPLFLSPCARWRLLRRGRRGAVPARTPCARRGRVWWGSSSGSVVCAGGRRK